MREILFRGQTRKRGQKVTVGGEKLPGIWVYGGIFPGAGDHSIIYGGDSEKLAASTLDKHMVYSETVGQFTGLTDKNGMKIFEGDIVEVRYDQSDGQSHSEVKQVIYDTEECCYFPMRWNESCEFCDGYTEITSIEVIGNIHDNPELLEET